MARKKANDAQPSSPTRAPPIRAASAGRTSAPVVASAPLAIVPASEKPPPPRSITRKKRSEIPGSSRSLAPKNSSLDSPSITFWRDVRQVNSPLTNRMSTIAEKNDASTAGPPRISPQALGKVKARSGLRSPCVNMEPKMSDISPAKTSEATQKAVRRRVLMNSLRTRIPVLMRHLPWRGRRRRA